MAISAACPNCAATFKAPDQLAGKKVPCPKCGERMSIPSAVGPTADLVGGAQRLAKASRHTAIVNDEPATTARPQPIPPDSASMVVALPAASPFVAPSTNSTMNQVGRFLSLPWIVLIFVFGFLPWSEVSCNAKDVHLHVTQSGYQTLYGGVSSAYNVAELVREKASAEMDVDREQFSKTLEAKRSDLLASLSPFALILWATVLAFLLIVLLAPLSYLRLKYCGPLAALMLLMLVVQLIAGTPLERGVNEAVHQVIEKDPAKALAVAGMIASGETVWFWLVFAAVFLMAGTEVVTNLLWRNSFASVSHTGPTSVVISAGVVAAAGVALQMLLWQVGVMRMESRLAELDRPEQERIARVKADEERQKQERQRQQAELQLQAERQRLEAEKKDRELAQEREQQRVESERQRVESERLKDVAEQVRLEEEKKAREKLAAQQAEQKIRDDKAAAERKAREEIEEAKAAEVRKKEEERKKDLEAHGKPYYPMPTTLFEEKNAPEWFQYTKDAKKYSQVEAGLKALETLKDEGEPFLLKLLEGASTSKEYNLYLRSVNSQYIHFNDLLRLVPYLDKKQSTANRLFVLTLFSERKESKPLLAQIDFRVSDLESDPEHKAEVKQLLNAIGEAK
jgi:hypothetical protein